MLVLFETPAGYALFKVKNEGKISDVDNLYKEFETPEKANKIVKLQSFSKFGNTTEALSAATALVDGKLSKDLKTFLKTELVDKKVKEELAVADSKLGGLIKETLSISCVHDAKIQELIRGIRTQLNNLITGLPENEMKAMILGLSHSLSRYKLKFSPDKVDTMIIQAIALLDDLDKELNTYAMRAKEWYGWHFPELAKVVVDNVAFAKTVKLMGFRTNASKTDFSTVLPEELEQEVKDLAEISMGTEISDEDISNITHLCDQVISLSEYRGQLFEYLKNRMNAIAPNLTCMVGELVGARLISHAGSLMNLAKHPASTVQILGAEKALFRALKTKHDTPKYGLIYHASLVGQAAPKYKGKISRVLAAKTALSVRIDALGEKVTSEQGMENRLKVENRLRQLEGKQKIASTAVKTKTPTKKYEKPEDTSAYNASADSTLPSADKKVKEEKKEKKEKVKEEKKIKKEKVEEEEEAEPEVKEEKKIKKEKKVKEEKEEKKEKKVKEEKEEKEEKKEKKSKKETPKAEVKEEKSSKKRKAEEEESGEKKKKKKKADE